jgi:methionyl-tRNA formyltransferase
LILESVEMIAAGQEPRVVQDDFQATFAPLLSAADCEIDWKLPAKSIASRVRGLNPHPGAKTHWNRDTLKIQAANWLPDEGGDAIPGQIVRTTPQGIDVQTGEGLLRILALQPQNKKSMLAKEFLNGYRLDSDHLFGPLTET